MYLLYLLLLFDFSSSAEKIPQIKIEWTITANGIPQSSVANSVLYFEKKFEIQIKINTLNRNYNVNVNKEILCYKYSTKTLLFKKYLNGCTGISNCYTAEKTATAAMSTAWQCQLNINNKDYSTSVFDVQVHYPHPGILLINGKNIKPDQVSNPHFDSYTTYPYIDGEMAEFKCQLGLGTKVSMELHYDDGATDQKTVIPEKKRTSMVQLKLSKPHIPKHLDCIVAQMDFDSITRKTYSINNTLRVYFSPGDLRYPTFKINDLVLTTKMDTTKTMRIVFKYDYYDNERVILDSYIDKSYSGIECTIYNKSIPDHLLDGYQQQQQKIELGLPLILDKPFNGFQVNCKLYVAHNTRSYSTAAREGTIKSHISLDFKLIASTGLKPSITGFSWANILTKYQYIDKDNNDERALIEYSYREEELALTCTAADAGIKWSYNDDQVDSNTLKAYWNNEISRYQLKQRFKLKPNCNRAVISCSKDYDGNTTIELIRGEPLFDDIPAIPTNTDMKPSFPDPGKVLDINTSFLNNERNPNTNNFDYHNHIDTTTEVLVTTQNPDKPEVKVEVNIEPERNGDTKPKDLNFSNGANGVTFSGFNFSSIEFVDKNQDSDKKNPKIDNIPYGYNPNTQTFRDPKTDVTKKPDKDDTDTDTHTELNPDPDTKSTTEFNPVSESSKKVDDEEEKAEYWRLIAIILGVLMIAVNVTLVAFCIFKLYKKGRQERENQGIVDYENLPEHNEGPMPMPKQWNTNEPTYATPHQNTTNMLYTKPIPKNQRTENVYSDLTHCALEPTYANAGKTIEKKNNIVFENNKKDATDYANLSALSNVDTYAKVVPKSQRKSEVEYKNICRNDTNDCLEPAYAEIGKK